MANKPNTSSPATATKIPEPLTTQRAYTLRLRPAIGKDDTPEEVARKKREMHDALWATHEAVNKGAKFFGDWLLTLRGGLSHELADPALRRPEASTASDVGPSMAGMKS